MTPPDVNERLPIQPKTRRLNLSLTQLIASALAAITATVAGSYLGISGTVIGAAVASVVTVLGNAIYSHSLRSTGARVRAVVPSNGRWPSAQSDEFTAQDGYPTQELPRPNRTVGPAPMAGDRRRSKTSLRVLAIASAAVFACVLILVTAVEFVAGRPLSDLITGGGGEGSSLFGDHTPLPTRHRAPAPVASTASPSAATLPSTMPSATASTPAPATVTVTAPVTGTPSSAVPTISAPSSDPSASGLLTPTPTSAAPISPGPTGPPAP